MHSLGNAKARPRGNTPRASRLTPRGRMNPQIWGFEGVCARRTRDFKVPAVMKNSSCQSTASHPSAQQAAQAKPAAPACTMQQPAQAVRHPGASDDRPLTAVRHSNHKPAGGGGARTGEAAPRGLGQQQPAEVAWASPLRYGLFGASNTWQPGLLFRPCAFAYKWKHLLYCSFCSALVIVTYVVAHVCLCLC